MRVVGSLILSCFLSGLRFLASRPEARKPEAWSWILFTDEEHPTGTDE